MVSAPPTMATVYRIYDLAKNERRRGPAHWVLNRRWAQQLRESIDGSKAKVAPGDHLIGIPIVLVDHECEPHIVVDNAGYL